MLLSFKDISWNDIWHTVVEAKDFEKNQKLKAVAFKKL